VPPELFEEWAARDPIELYADRLVSKHGFEVAEVDGIREEVRRYVDECAERAIASQMPEPELALEGVFAEEFEVLGDGEAPWSRWSAAGNGRPA
jgi:TPP-dependent pyruvate/acetoin dehydrogenase alpha subunit